MKKLSLEAQLGLAHTVIRNALQHPGVKKKMEVFGYTASRVQEGEYLLKAVEALQMNMENNYSVKKSVREQLEADIKALKVLYAEHISIARFAFRNDTYMKSQLQLKGTRKQDWAGWTTQVYKFYVRVEQEGLPLMKKHGAVAEELAQGKAMAEALLATHNRQKSNTGNAQSATQKRNQALKALNLWVSNYKKIARVALQDDPQLLEVLGITVSAMH